VEVGFVGSRCGLRGRIWKDMLNGEQSERNRRRPWLLLLCYCPWIKNEKLMFVNYSMLTELSPDQRHRRIDVTDFLSHALQR
jgi:hypothetical protein